MLRDRIMREQWEKDTGEAENGREGILVIGADTVVSYQGQILGKPVDTDDAVRMLSMLQGNAHSVFTGVTLIRRGLKETWQVTFAEETRVHMYPMTEAEIRWYVGTGEPMDKAGAYGIQGLCARFVEKIEGDYNNVVGLPVGKIWQELKKRCRSSQKEGIGCVHHSNYIRWFEEARTAYLEQLDMGYARMEEEGISSPVLTVQAEYRSMTRYGETVKIGMRIVKYNGIRLMLEYQVTDAASGVLRCVGQSSHCFLDREGKIVSLKKERPLWDEKLRKQMEDH